ncbi:ATP-dependent DNA ligase [Microbacterium sp. STN6]|uniref:DUF7882 family protein n=1 Tax=Microbacterium sp. STN6 TaxID=2995588 RepID=UPI002260C098|nr:ATP-dependent DNA ligase [Microbacterium sp. STN6]MCX7522464.1 ATP-dependent DNA ligase [Microbacterium sp. STN6]
MGKLTYDSTLTIDFDDRVLAHLQMVIGAKLRRNEAFYFSWKDDTAIGDGRSTLWMHPTIPIYFKFAGGKQPSINRRWVDALMMTANSPSGLQLVPEPASNGEGEFDG